MANKEEWLRVILIKEPNEPEAMPVAFVEDKAQA